MTAWLEGDIQADAISIHYYRTGGEKPSIVLLHGLSDNGLCWTPIAQELEQEYDVIMLDARGHGLSGGPVNGFSLPLLAADVAASIQSLQLGRTRLLGHSMGGVTAALVAARYPDLVQTLLLEDPPWLAEPLPAETPVSGSVNDPRQQWLLTARAQTREARIAQARKDNPSWPEAELAPWADSKDQLDLSIYQYNIGVALFRPYWRELVGDIHCPTLLLTANPKRGAAVSPEVAQQAIQALSNGQLAYFQEAGHNIRREQHDAYMNAIQTFLHTHKS
jgi:pimeloyl-ACP methyl ester carboxylesterase